MKPIPIPDQIQEVKQELKRREADYAEFVNRELMTQDEADIGLLRMRAVLATLETLWSRLDVSQIDWRNTLLCRRDAVLSDAQRQYRRLALRHHPDRGGDPQKFAELNAAIDAAKQEFSE